MASGISLANTALLEEVQRRAKARDPKPGEVERLARRFDEDPEYVKIAWQEKRYSHACAVIDEMSDTRLRFIRKFWRSTDRWLAIHLGLTERKIRDARVVLRRREHRRRGA